MRMAREEVEYLERRVVAATELAQRATHPAAVKAHYTMATAYLARLYPDMHAEAYALAA